MDRRSFENGRLSSLVISLFLLLSINRVENVPIVPSTSTSASSMPISTTFIPSSSSSSSSTSSSLMSSMNKESSEPLSSDWRYVLTKKTEENPCGSLEYFNYCTECGKTTGNEDAFYYCCVNVDNVRQFCIDFLNHKLPLNQ